jgi:hypothetical protein
MATSMKDLQATIDELEDTIEQACGVLEAVYQPESSREDLAEAVGQALDLLTGEEEDEDENGDD